jgi:hypothetical protein
VSKVLPALSFMSSFRAIFWTIYSPPLRLKIHY